MTHERKILKQMQILAIEKGALERAEELLEEKIGNAEAALVSVRLLAIDLELQALADRFWEERDKR